MKTATGRTRKFIATLMLLAVVMLGLAGPSTAAPPYGTGVLTITISITNPGPGQTITITITGAGQFDTIIIVIHSAPVTLGTFTASANGSLSAPVTIPSSFSGAHTIVATDQQTGLSTSIPITIGATVPGNGSSTVPGNGSSTLAGNGSSTVPGNGSSDAGGLPNTGAAVMGLGALALVLLAGGGTLLILGRRRVRRSS